MARIRRTGSGNTGTSSRHSGRTSTSTSRKHTNQRATRNTGKTSSSGNTRKTSSSSKKSTNGISGKAVSGSKGASQTQAKHRQVRNDTFVSAKSIPQNKQIQNVDSKQIRNKDLSNENKKENKDTVSLSNHYRVYTLQSQNTGNHIKSLEPSVKKNSRSAEAKTDEKETAEVQKNRTDSFERSSRLRNGENTKQSSGYERHIAQLRQSNILNQGNFAGLRKTFYSQGNLSKNEENRIGKQQSSGKEISTSAGRTVSPVKKVKVVKKQKSNKIVDKKRNVIGNENKTVKKKFKTIKVKQKKCEILSSTKVDSSKSVLQQNVKALTKETKKIIEKDLKELVNLLSGFKLGKLDIANKFKDRLNYISKSPYLDKTQKQKAILQESITFLEGLLGCPVLDSNHIKKRSSGLPDNVSNQLLFSFVGKRKFSKEEVEFYSGGLATTAEKGMIALSVLAAVGGSSVSVAALSKAGGSVGGLSVAIKNIFSNPGSVGVSGDGTLVLTGAAEGELVAALAGSLEVVIEFGESLSAALSITGNNKSGSSHSTQNTKKIPKVDVNSLPSHVQNSFHRYEKAGWDKSKDTNLPQNARSGLPHQNREGHLPTLDKNGKKIAYTEHDVNNAPPGVNRGKERFVIGSDGSVYYTNSHYGQGSSLNNLPPFIQIK